MTPDVDGGGQAVAVDREAGLLYWTDNRRGRFSISRSGLAGEDQQLVCSQTNNHNAYQLAVSGGWAYWTDSTTLAVWRTNLARADCRSVLVLVSQWLDGLCGLICC